MKKTHGGHSAKHLPDENYSMEVKEICRNEFKLMRCRSNIQGLEIFTL